ncbi:MAG: hypothetical protein Q9209_003771 [Squamulea sp. 1 TL-2023]
MPSKRMTANQIKPARYRPGKPVAEEHSSEDEYETENEEQSQSQQSSKPSVPPPKASSFPTDAAKIANNLRDVDLNVRRQQAAVEEAARLAAEKLQREREEEGFETAESEDSEANEDSEGSIEESESGSEETSSEDEAPRKLLRPTFIKKDMRKDGDAATNGKTEDDMWLAQEAERKAKANAVIQEQLDKDVAARAAGKKDWDDDEDVDAEEVDNADDVDPETERAAWRLRELKRVKRDREAIEEAEKEREEVERRRNLTKEEREAEDREFLEQQKEEREGKGRMGYMQKYFHKGAFFQDDAEAGGMDRRDIMGSRYQDDVVNRELLPEYMQIRDMTKLGRKGRTKYKDLKSEDTGRWGQSDHQKTRRDNTLDERFQPDRDGGGGNGPSGANSTAVGERRKAPEDQKDVTLAGIGTGDGKILEDSLLGRNRLLHVRTNTESLEDDLIPDQDHLHHEGIDINTHEDGPAQDHDQGRHRFGGSRTETDKTDHGHDRGHQHHVEIDTETIVVDGNEARPRITTVTNHIKDRR